MLHTYERNELVHIYIGNTSYVGIVVWIYDDIDISNIRYMIRYRNEIIRHAVVKGYSVYRYTPIFIDDDIIFNTLTIDMALSAAGHQSIFADNE